MKTTLYIACSLDGYIAAPGDDLSFLSAVEKEGEDYGYAAFHDSIDTVIMGRKTYDKVLSFGIDFPHEGKKVVVLSKTKAGKEGHVTFFSGDVTALFQELRTHGSRHVFCDGGAETVWVLLQNQLIDEFIISVIPVLLGAGVRLFKEGFEEQALTLIDVKHFDTGLVQLNYRKQENLV